MHCVEHDQNLFSLIMIETASRGSFDHDQTKGVRREVEITLTGTTRKQNFWYKYSTDEEIHHQISAMDRKQNLWDNFSQKLRANSFKHTGAVKMHTSCKKG